MDIQRSRGVAMDIRPPSELEFPVVEPAGASEMEITLPEEGEVMEVNPPSSVEMNVLPGQ